MMKSTASQIILSYELCPREQRLELARKLLMRNRFQRRTRNEDVLSAFQLRAHSAHILTHEPPDAVARDGIAHLRGNREAELLLPSLQVDQHEIP